MSRPVVEATRLWTLAVPAVSSFVMSLVRNVQDRDDILQDVAQAAIEDFARYDRSRPFVAWVIGIARNQVRLHYRRKARSMVVFDSEAVDALAEAFAAEDGVMSQRLAHLESCVELLDERSRKLCRLRYDDDLKPAAIAARIGMEANTVAKALQRVRDRLRECMERKVVSETGS